MAFSGAPEIINSRLAMLAMVSALGAEFVSHESVLKQFSDAPTAILAVAGIFSAASLITYMNGAYAKGESMGPFTPVSSSR